MAAGAPPATGHRLDGTRDWGRLFAARTSGAGDALAAILSQAVGSDLISFAGGFPAPEAFPVDELRQLSAELLAGPDVALQYSPTEGLPTVREAVADLIADRQGRRPERTLITSGGIEALQLLARVLVDPGDTVLVEAPTYLGAIMAFTGFQADVRGVAIDADGLRVEELAALKPARHPPKLLYVIPDHQNPSGLSMSADRRQALVELARRHEFLIVEDVAYRDLGFDGTAQATLWSLAPDVVVQVGTFSKIFMPGVRLGWAVGPDQIITAMTAAKQNSDQCAGALGQRLMERYLRRGYLDASLARARRLYGDRARAMLLALQRHMPPGVRWTHPRGGFFIWVTAPADVDTTALHGQASALGVSYVPGRPFYPAAGGRNQLRLAFSRAREDDIDEGVRRLATLFLRTAAETS